MADLKPDSYGPPLPPGFVNTEASSRKEPKRTTGPSVYGPPLPPTFGSLKRDDKSKDSTASYGPELPPRGVAGRRKQPCGPPELKRSISSSSASSSSSSSSEASPSGSPSPKRRPASYGPDLPPDLLKGGAADSERPAAVYGPPLPPGLNAKVAQSTVPGKAYYGPTVSPAFQPKPTTSKQIYGPEMPRVYQKTSSADKPTAVVKPTKLYGPPLPPSFHSQADPISSDEEEEEEMGGAQIGPLIPGNELTEELRHFRAEKTDVGGGRKSSPGLQRDSWMTELPSTGQEGGPSRQLGLIARKFRTGASAMGGSRSAEEASRLAWLAAPGQEAQLSEDLIRKRQQEEAEDRQMAERDAVKADEVDQYNRDNKRVKSLMEIHEKKRLKKDKKKKKKKGRSRSGSFSPTQALPSRRAFDRDQDLRVGGMDETARKSFIAHSKSFGARFGHGKQKFS